LNDGDDPYDAHDPDTHDHDSHDRSAHDHLAHDHGEHDGDVDFADPHAVRTRHDRDCTGDPEHDHPHDGDPLEPGAYDDSTAETGDRYATTNEPGGDTRPADRQDDQWGFPKEKRGMSTETKIGLALVVLLLGTFGFVVWKKMQHRDNVLATTYEEHDHAHDHGTASVQPVPPPTPAPAPAPTPAPAPVPVVLADAHDHAHGHAHDHPIAEPPKPEPVPADVLDDWANIEQTSRQTTPRNPPPMEPDPFGELDADRHPAHTATNTPPGRATVDFDDFAEFEAPREIPRQQPRANDLPEYEFEADLFPPREQPATQHAHRHDIPEPGRLEVVDLAAFGDPRVKPAAAEECPTTGTGNGQGFDFDARQKPVPQRTSQANDGWGDFTPPDQRPSRPQPAAADCPLDDGWGNPVPPRTGQNTGRQPSPADFCPVEPVPTHLPSDATQPAPNIAGGYPAGTRIYTVQNGDTYWTISRSQYGTAGYFSALAQYNVDRIPDPKRMRPGMKVVVPPAAALHTRYPKLCGNGTHTVAHQNTEPAGFFVGADGSPKYRIGETDTLSDIAHAHLGRASRWVQIYELNRVQLPRPETLRIGTVLDLPRDASSVRLVRTAGTYR
jgi:nucleoid-associated protein YgaU